MNQNCGSGFTPRLGTAGFTLVELLIGMSLALMIMTAVLVSYTTLARNFTRSLGISSANQPPIEEQSRRTLAQFTHVRMASGISGTPSATSLVLTLPTGTGSKSVAYYFNNTASAVTVTLVTYSTTIPATSLVRVDGTNGATLIPQTSLPETAFNYYDSSGNPYTSFTNYLPGIKQLAFTLTAQAGSSTNGTLTHGDRIHPRNIRNKALLQ